MKFYKLTTYGPKEYLRSRGYITEGELQSVPVSRGVSVNDIQRAVANWYGLPLIEMTSARRSREVARPRQVSMYLAKRLTGRSLPQIGRLHGGRDHTTVIHGIRQIERLSKVDTALAADVLGLAQALGE
jgi:chromosomal replication initiator protein